MQEYLDNQHKLINNDLCRLITDSQQQKTSISYVCEDCKVGKNTVCCEMCVKYCHDGHEISKYTKKGKVYCSCGQNKLDQSCHLIYETLYVRFKFKKNVNVDSFWDVLSSIKHKVFITHINKKLKHVHVKPNATNGQMCVKNINIFNAS